jgi:hypothetical protein
MALVALAAVAVTTNHGVELNIVQFADDLTGELTPSKQQLATRLGLCVGTVANALDRLKAFVLRAGSCVWRFVHGIPHQAWLASRTVVRLTNLAPLSDLQCRGNLVYLDPVIASRGTDMRRI